MSGALVPLERPAPEPDRHVVEQLEHALAAARAGRLTAILIISESESATHFAKAGDFADDLRVIGALERAKIETINRMYVEDSDEKAPYIDAGDPAPGKPIARCRKPISLGPGIRGFTTCELAPGHEGEHWSSNKP